MLHKALEFGTYCEIKHAFDFTEDELSKLKINSEIYKTLLSYWEGKYSVMFIKIELNFLRKIPTQIFGLLALFLFTILSLERSMLEILCEHIHSEVNNTITEYWQWKFHWIILHAFNKFTDSLCTGI